MSCAAADAITFWDADVIVMHDDGRWKVHHGSAFTVAELGEMLHEGLKGAWKGVDGKWRCKWTHSPASLPQTFDSTFEPDTEACARAKMLVYLLENNLITV